VSHATSAPLWNVAKIPQRNCDSAAVANEWAKPRSANAKPDPIKPITTDRRRLIMSGDDARGNLEDQIGALEDRAEQEQMERIESQREHDEDRVDALSRDGS
jgi:hypothetical protein